MKPSKYNIFLQRGQKYYVFNQLSSDLREIDSELNDALTNGEIDGIKDSDLLLDLANSQLICEDELQEEYLIVSANKTFRFANNTARITIMPTLECNFNCWYCYEVHSKGHMKQEDLNAVISFCEKIILNKNINTFVLDWFGGEPLLYFKQIVYPISKKIQKICQDNNIKFLNSITTNGFFINYSILGDIREIGLQSFQITLDGAKQFHDKTRYFGKNKGSYDRIVNNIVMLCREIKDINMTLRINYTPANLNTIDLIVDSFPIDVRNKIFIEPQLVWQFKDDINPISNIIKDKMESFRNAGFMTRGTSIPCFSNWCYAESMNQFVINYNLDVYKCTARNFDSNHSIGKIDLGGNFNPNHKFYRYYTNSYFENEECLKCNLLPSCTGMCIQKKIEGTTPKCPKNNIYLSIVNSIVSIIDYDDCQV